MNNPKRAHDQPTVVGASLSPPPAAAGRPEFQVKVRLRNPMRPQRVYPVEVQLQEFPPGRPFTDISDAAVQVRLSVPGAHVTPAEVRLDPSEPGAQATAYVTPLARGTLPGARAEVVQGGRVVQEIPLGVRGRTQRLTWTLAGLTVLVPLFLMVFCRYAPYQRQMPTKPAGPPTVGTPNRAAVPPGGQGVPKVVIDRYAVSASAVGFLSTPDQGPLVAAAAYNPEDVPFPPPYVERHPGPPPAPGQPGESLTATIQENVYPIPGVTEPLADWLGTTYQTVCNLTREDRLAFWVALTLLVLTLVSWLVHLPFPVTRLGKPFTLEPASGEVFSAKTLPLGGSEQPVMIEPAGD